MNLCEICKFSGLKGDEYTCSCGNNVYEDCNDFEADEDFEE